MKRLDLALVEWGLAPSRTKAQALIAAGELEICINGSWAPANDNSQDVENLTAGDVRISGASKTLKFVSRGGLKLEAAFAHLKLEPSGWRCLDVGISTGGFSDFLLQNGAAAILGIDVGHGQLHPSLAGDNRVSHVENLNVKDIAGSAAVRDWLRGGVDFCVADLSFISLTLALPPLSTVLSTGTPLLALVKPQFEVGKQTVTEDLFADVQRRVLIAAGNCGFSVQEYFASPVRGQDGNQEFFLLCRRS
jgi:23S rRNA (cytidine1920-2'-O)/16S rRNA (cytidine1409-2'-O)-methyltransferase